MRLKSYKGGGLRGLLTARLGERLEELAPGWDAQIDVRAGASTGGILALGRAAGKTWPELVELYTQHAGRIFHDTTWDNLKDVSVGGVSLRGAQYSSDGLLEVLDENFATMRLGDLDCDVLIPALDLDNQGNPRHWKAKFFSQRHDAQELVVDVAMRTAAAPTYFPTYQGYADGGLIANDPSVCLIAYAMREHTKRPMSELVEGGLELLSMGTGAVPKYIEGESSHDWGALKWVRHLLDVLMDGGMMAPVYQAATVLGSSYHHLNPWLPREIPLDGDAWEGVGELEASMQALVEVADAADLGPTVEWLGVKGWCEREGPSA